MWTFVGMAAVAVALSAAPAYGQCGGTISVADDPNSVIGNPFTHLVVGQELELVVNFGPVDDSATVNSFTVSLDCQLLETLSCGAACTDDGLALLYLGDGTISAYTCGPFGAVGIESDQPGGLGAANMITFTFVDALGDPDPILLPAGETCGFRFGVRVNTFSTDASNKRITGKGETTGSCTGGDPFGLCGAYSIFLADPQISIAKSVEPVEECEGSGNSVTYTYEVTNAGDVPLSNIVVVDDNGTPPTPPAVPAVGDDFNPDPVDVLPGPPDGFNDGDTNLDNILDLTETWLYTHIRTVASLPNGPTTNTAVVNGDYVNVIGTTTVDDDNPATVTINPAPSCLILPPESDDCASRYCVTTDACVPFTVVWTGPDNFTSTADCITLGVNDAAGEYCVEVTDCNGCTSGGPGSDCCIDFTPPVPPPCTITGDTEICSGDAAVEWCAPDVAGATYAWTGPGIPAGEADDRCIHVSTAGERCVTVTDADGCTCRDCETLIVNPPPPCTITGDTLICSGSSTQWCAPVVTGATYAWTGPSIPAGQEDDRCITVSAAGQYCVTVTSEDGCICEDCETLALEDCGGEACSPGYWKQDQHFEAWCEANFNPTANFCFAGPATLFKTAFGMVNADFVVPLPGGYHPNTLTLLEAVRNKLQGCNKQILFQGTAAILNAAAIPSFGHTVADVQAVMKDAFDGTITFCEAANIFSGWTNTAEAAGGCPCNNDGCQFDAAAAVAPAESTDVQPVDVPPAIGSNSWCGLGTATMMPLGLVGWTLMRRKRSGNRQA